MGNQSLSGLIQLGALKDCADLDEMSQHVVSNRYSLIALDTRLTMSKGSNELLEKFAHSCF